jgi:adenosylmethionine-8-amino-7-oxononanoate aminotransferase
MTARVPGALWPSLLPVAQQGTDELCAVSADGVRVRFADGRELLCGTSGLWNTNLGYGNPVVADAIGAAARDASYLSVFRYENRYARQAAEALADRWQGSDARVLFATSGGSANDLVMKLARHTQALRGFDRRKIVVGLRGSYHGLTFGGFALTGEDLGQGVYGVDQRLVRHVAANDTTELTTAFDRFGAQVAAVVVEPVLGSGTVPLAAEFVAELIRLRQLHGFLLVADEVATGFGRTGTFLASQLWPEPADLVIVSKGLTNGTNAAAAVLVSAEVARTFDRADAVLTHAETQAGTPIACAAMLATLSEFDRLQAVARGTAVAQRLATELQRWAARSPRISAVTGRGCFRSLRLATAAGLPLPSSEVPIVVREIRRAGAIVHPGPHGIQLVPALTYSVDDLQLLLDATRTGLHSYFAATDDDAADGQRPVGVMVG